MKLVFCDGTCTRGILLQRDLLTMCRVCPLCHGNVQVV
uniref:Uncharacterized protein n=1 Tax=Anguilla anguilla TaxID=7936 RepID=A0A0E9WZ31_ANGAN